MNDQQIKDTLTQLAEDGVPAEANLWPALRARLARGRAPAFDMKGTLMLKPVFGGSQARAARTLAAATLAMLLLAAALLVTPQGRAWAQSLWQFFTLAPADSFAVEPVANPQADAPTAAPPSVNAGECGADLACQVRSAEALVGFTPVVPAEGFAGLTLQAVDAAGGILRLSYVAQGGGGLVLSQGQGDLTASQWDEVAAGAVETVQIGGGTGEFVQGTFVVPAGSSTAVWDAEAPVLRLRWQAGDRHFELAKLGAPEYLDHLDKEALIALAEGLQ
jgi:hypothetical protein